MSLPTSFKSYFWDVDFKQIDPVKNSFFITKRVIDQGKTADVHWLVDKFGPEKIQEVIASTRDLSRDTGNFWADIFQMDKTKIPCLTRPYSPIPFGRFS